MKTAIDLKCGDDVYLVRTFGRPYILKLKVLGVWYKDKDIGSLYVNTSGSQNPYLFNSSNSVYSIDGVGTLCTDWGHAVSQLDKQLTEEIESERVKKKKMEERISFKLKIKKNILTQTKEEFLNGAKT